MNDLTKALYFIDVAKELKCTLGFISVFSFLLLIISSTLVPFIASIEWYGDESYLSLVKKWSKFYIIVACVCFFTGAIQSLIPSQQTMYLMLSSEAADKMVQSQDFKKLYTKSYELLNKKIDEALSDGSKK